MLIVDQTAVRIQGARDMAQYVQEGGDLSDTAAGSVSESNAHATGSYSVTESAHTASGSSKRTEGKRGCTTQQCGEK